MAEKIQEMAEKTEISEEDRRAITKAKELLEKKKEKKEELTKVEEPRREKFISNAGIAYIFSSYNNTILHITDLSGNTLARVSGGQITKHDRLKANPTVAMFAAKKVAEIIKEQGINSLYVRIKAKGGLQLMPGPGARAAIRSLGKEGIRIINIVETTPFARGGPKLRGGKRGRRV